MTDKSQYPSSMQFLDLANVISNETCRYLEGSNITVSQLDKIRKQETLIRQLVQKNTNDILQLVPDSVTQAKQQLEQYFLEIFNLKINLSKIVFPQKTGFNTFMAVPPLVKLNEDQIMVAFVKKWGIDTYKYLSPVAKNINRKAQQSRPKGLYVFAYRGGDEPDAEHLGESYNDAISAGYPFAKAREYLLITGFHKFIHDRFMDKKGWTRTSSLWSDGDLVFGDWSDASSELKLFRGDRDGRDSVNGPRELLLD